jgi:hypothetical protein
MPPSLFELRRARNLKAAPKRSDAGTKEERDDRSRPALAELRVTKSRAFLSSHDPIMAEGRANKMKEQLVVNLFEPFP